jgi:hypothetical protein
MSLYQLLHRLAILAKSFQQAKARNQFFEKNIIWALGLADGICLGQKTKVCQPFRVQSVRYHLRDQIFLLRRNDLGHFSCYTQTFAPWAFRKAK